MKEHCVVISIIVRKEDFITAESEGKALQEAKRLYETGKLAFTSKDKANVNFHIKVE